MKRVTVDRRYRAAPSLSRVSRTLLALTALLAGTGVLAPALTASAQEAASAEASAQSRVAAPNDGTQPLAAIRSAAEAYVRSLIPASAGESTVNVGELDSRLRLAHCPRALVASLTAGMSLQARSTVGVSCNGPVHWTVYLPVTVESKIEVLVLTRPVNRDDRLTPADVTVETRRTAGPGTAYLTKLSDLSGRTVKRPLAAGTTLAVDMFTPDLIVRRGQQVTLLSSGGAIEVRASGRAMVDGAAGARIQVQNLSSMRVIEGVVESADLVRVAR
ncbi:MAG TPA: flagellar basal body P-ring formation chaperone FlgA [Steroidobacteraceae bacterium]|nr:flagellar basal body P-ring formation chaperone FlgA [Steroidobacteraceae bacterium]